MAEIFVCKPCALDVETKAALKEAGVIVVEMADPEAFKFIRADAEIDSGLLLSSAIKALSSKSDGTLTPATENRSRFVNLLAAGMDSARGVA